MSRKYFDMLEEHVRDPRRFPSIDRHGHEIIDPVPLAPPVGHKREVPLHVQIRDMVNRERQRAKEAEEFETFEESDDFDVGDDYDPSSPFEHDFDVAPVSELRRRALEDLQKANEPPPENSATPPNAPPAKAKQKAPPPPDEDN